ncbi:hypothetical protein QQ045_028253 [Rhodiola kirilowii]
MNYSLLKDISDEEIKTAVFSIGALKAPGIDGFPAIFYQKHWEIIKSSVIKEVRDFWASGVLDKEINRTLIVLIPKKKDAVRVEDWRPISLCTVAIKIITKIIVNRLQPLLNEIISPVQSAFVRGRIISDNFIVAHEIANYMKTCRDDRNFFASVKVDMSKAYDRVEWLFLERLLYKMGFATIWIDRVMRCVRSLSYQIKVNNNISRVFRPSRGLRQGDPLSPYLFLLCTEFLNAKMAEGVSRKFFSGITVCIKAPTISHLFFADDSIFFLKANPSEAYNLKSLLHQYEFASGQRINFEKSEVCFSKNTAADIRVSVCEALRVPQVECHSRYLGMPLLVGQKKTDIFRGIVEKIWRKVKDWKCKLLSAGGREILIKAVLQAIPTYMMSVYSFPRKTISDVYKLLHQFWWDTKDGGRGISWLRQDIMRRRKSEGGLGFKDLAVFNKDMLLKIGWRIVKYPDLLMSRVLVARYCRGESIFEARLGNNPSHLWRGVMEALPVFMEGIWWDETKGSYRWKYSSTGNFTVKSAYDILIAKADISGHQVGEQSDKRFVGRFWKRLWSSNIPNKVKVFCWRFFHNSLPDAINLGRRGVLLERSCKICGFPSETALHIAKECWWAKALFSKFNLAIPSDLAEAGSSADWLWWGHMNLHDTEFKTFLVALWLCWRNRNDVWHDKGCWSIVRAVIVGENILNLVQRSQWQNPSLCYSFVDKWTPPPQGEIKLNIDGAWDANTREAGLGVVARDHDGTVLWCWATQWSQGMCVSEVEGQALLLGLKQACDVGFRSVLVEVDSLDVYRVVSSGSGLADWCDSWLSATSDLLKANHGWRLRIINREANCLVD